MKSPTEPPTIWEWNKTLIDGIEFIPLKRKNMTMKHDTWKRRRNKSDESVALRAG
jgi:hypothetical protein